MPRSTITGRRKMPANNVSHANNRTKTWKEPNVQRRRLWSPTAQRWVVMNLTTRDLRTIDKIGLAAFLARHGKTIHGNRICLRRTP